MAMRRGGASKRAINFLCRNGICNDASTIPAEFKRLKETAKKDFEKMMKDRSVCVCCDTGLVVYSHISVCFSPLLTPPIPRPTVHTHIDCG